MIYKFRARLALIFIVFTLLHFQKLLIGFEQASQGFKRVLFVNTDFGMRQVFNETVSAVGEPFFCGRWLYGNFTNFKCITSTKLNLASSFVNVNVVEFDRGLKSIFFGFETAWSVPSLAFLSRASVSSIQDECSAVRIPAFGILDSDEIGAQMVYASPGNNDATISQYFYNQTVAYKIVLVKMRVFILSKYAKARII